MIHYVVIKPRSDLTYSCNNQHKSKRVHYKLTASYNFSITVFQKIYYLLEMLINLQALRFVIYPLIGSILGSLTNFIAIKLLFRPRKKILGIQGLLQKRKPHIAERAGEIVNSYLVNSEEIRKQIDKERLHRAIDTFIKKHRNTLWEIPIIKKIVKNIIVTILLDRDGYFKRNIIESIIDQSMVSGIVRQKINDFDVAAIEELFRKASGPEFQFIIFSGAILGFIIGLIEAFIGF